MLKAKVVRINDLQNNQLVGESKSIKVNQSDFRGLNLRLKADLRPRPKPPKKGLYRRSAQV
jgi:hypothetical protein